MTTQNETLESRLQREAREKIEERFEEVGSGYSNEDYWFILRHAEEIVSHTIAETLKAAVSAEESNDVQKMLLADNERMRVAGCKLAEAAQRVIREYDGIHRLSLAVAEWSKAIADEGNRAITAVEGVGKNEL